MKSVYEPVTILMADDDEDDRLLTREALKEGQVPNNFHWVEDGQELLNYLQRKGKYHDSNRFPMPQLILLDLNMPRMDGRKALSAIKSNSAFRRIPVIILTTSKNEADMIDGYNLGAASFIIKPVTFEKLVEVMTAMGHYWFDIVQLPAAESP